MARLTGKHRQIGAQQNRAVEFELDSEKLIGDRKSGATDADRACRSKRSVCQTVTLGGRSGQDASRTQTGLIQFIYSFMAHRQHVFTDWSK